MRSRLEDFRRPTIQVPNIGTIYPAKANFYYALSNYIKLIKTKPNRSYFEDKFRVL